MPFDPFKLMLSLTNDDMCRQLLAKFDRNTLQEIQFNSYEKIRHLFPSSCHRPELQKTNRMRLCNASRKL